MKKRRVSAIAKSKQIQRENIDKRKQEMNVIRGMLKILRNIQSEMGIVGHMRMTMAFDLFFVYVEPNNVKRRKRLNRIFKLAIRIEDKDWVLLIRKSYRKALVISKNNLIKLKK